MEKDFVCYEDFGAVGDGVADDFAAIYKAHEYANEHKLKVLGTPGKTYYIFDTTMGTDKVYTAVIKTEVDWRGAHFIIDDRKLSRRTDNPYNHLASAHIFKVSPDTEYEMFKIADADALSRIVRDGLNPDTKKIDLGIEWDGAVMIIPYNSDHRIYRRRGYGAFAGAVMHEIIVVLPDGSVSEETPITFDYTSLDYIVVYKLDKSTAITVKNGIFTTLESRVNHMDKNEDGTYTYKPGGYIARGMVVNRSYTTVENIEHRVEGGFTLLERAEGHLEGSPYWGLFRAHEANEVTFKNCIIPGRTAYGPRNGHSSYNFGADSVNKIVLDNCIQPNFWVTVDPESYEVKFATAYSESAVGHAEKTADKTVMGMGFVSVNGETRRLCWGVGGTNFCKNMEYRNSTLTRFDAHMGLYNGKIINCNISGMELTGVGNFDLIDTTWYPYSANTPLLFLRSDYGYHWDGDITVKNVKIYLYSNSVLNVANHYHSNWYYGYTCAFPNITIDNLKLFNRDTEQPLPAGYKIHYFRFLERAKQMHLSDAGTPSIYAFTDADGDGYIDEPRMDRNRDGKIDPPCDLDGDGRVGNTSLKYEDYVDFDNAKSGIAHLTSTVNLNEVKPPRYFKVVNNSEGYVYQIMDTSCERISDGAWYRDKDEPDTLGGFFGATEFIYEEGKSFVGTENKNGITDTFYFTQEYYQMP